MRPLAQSGLYMVCISNFNGYNGFCNLYSGVTYMWPAQTKVEQVPTVPFRRPCGMFPFLTAVVFDWQVYLPRVLNPKSPASPSQESDLHQSYGTSECSPVYSPVESPGESDGWFRVFRQRVDVFLGSGLSKLLITRTPQVESEAALSRENLQMLKRTKRCKGQNAGALPAPDFSKLQKMREISSGFLPTIFCCFIQLVLLLFAASVTAFGLNCRLWSFIYTITHLQKSKNFIV